MTKALALAVFTFGLFVVTDPAFSQERPPLPNFDRRMERSAPPPPPADPAGTPREQAERILKSRVGDVRIHADPVTHSPKWIGSTDRFLTGPNGSGGAVPARAAGLPANEKHRAVKMFLNEHRALFGHDATALSGAEIQREDTSPASGLQTVVWQQMLDGIPVFEGMLKATTSAGGELVNIGSQFVATPEIAADAGTPDREVAQIAPRISAAEAVALAAENVGVKIAEENVQPIGAPEGPKLQQSFSAQGLNEPRASLVWLPMDAAEMRLCWSVILTSKGRGEMFRVLVDADSGEVQLRHCLTEYISNASYRVFTSDSPTPMSPGLATPLTTQPPLAARALITTPALNTTASPNGWIDDGVNETRGNNVDAHLDLNSDDIADTPRPQGAAGRVFDFPLDLTLQAPAAYRDAAVTNLFYWCNLVHDRFYELGFTEASGNFQNNNFGRGGVGNDAVQADAQDGSGTNNANFSTPPDGSPGRMQMYVFTGPTPDRDGDFDSEIMIHEYAHGLSNRLVGGGVGISALQTRGMGEGWSDFYGLCLLAEVGDNIDGNFASGAYASYQLSATYNQNYYFGIRRYPYSTDLAKNPLTFKDIDPTKASTHAGIPLSPLFGGSDPAEVHNQGEVWCNTLWEVRAALVRKLGFPTGNTLALQLVTDGMKLSPANPNFLQARDAIIQAELALTGGTNRGEVWGAFAKRGMGANAISPASGTTTGVVENYDLPDTMSVSPTSGFTSRGDAGGPFSVTSTAFTLRNNGAGALNWTASTNAAWLTLSLGGGTLASGGTATLTASLNAAANALANGLYAGTVTVTNTTSGIAQTRTFALRVGVIDYFTEVFDTTPNDTAFQTFTFTPNGSPSFYRASRSTATVFPTDPAGGTALPLGDDTFNTVTLTGGATVPFYGTNYATFYVGSNGYVTFGNGDSSLGGSLSSHFASKRIAALMEDLYPSTTAVTWKQLADRVAVTFQNVPEYGISNSNSFQIEMFFDGRVRITMLGVAATGGLIGLSNGTGVPADFAESDFTAYGPDAFLTLTAPAQANEGAGVLVNAGRVTATPAPAANLTVTLASSRPADVAVPATVTILAGQTFVQFPLTIGNNTLLDGSRTAVLTASAASFALAQSSVIVNDNETGVLTVSAPSSATEGGANPQGTVTVNAAVGAGVFVTLTSGNPAEIQVPAGVTILSGQTSATFPITIVDDTRLDGTVATAITAQVTNWTPGSATISVLDNETTDLTITAPATLREGDTGKTGTVRLGGSVSTPLVVALYSDDTTEITVPATVTIPAGQTSATFPITVIDDALADGAQPVMLTAFVDGFSWALAIVSVADNDAHHFTMTPIAGPVLRSAPVAVSVTARDVNDAIITNYNQTVSFTAGNVPVTPASGSGFVNGVLSLNLAFTAYGSGVVLTVADTGGHTAASNPFDVTFGALSRFEWSTIGATQNVDGPFAVTLRAADALGNPVPTFTGTATLDARIGATGPSLPVSPSITASFVAGEWSGNVSVPFTGIGVVLRATAGALSGVSNEFAVVTPLPPSATGTIYSEDFESGTLPTLWTITGTGNFRTQITTYSPHLGTRHLAMDEALDSGTYARNEATLTLNLTGRTGVMLKFWAAQFGDEPDGPPASPFPSTGANFDGVAISADGGANWYEVQPLRTLTGVYSQLTVDLDAAIAARGLAYSSAFKIRFNQYDNFSLGTDGIGIDDVLVTANVPPSGLTLSLPAQAAEGAGAIQGSVSVSPVRQTAQVLNLSSKSAAKVTVPATVTIPAGQTSATFPMTVLDDPFVDGTKSVVITAVGTGFLETGATMQIIDNDGGALTLTLPASMTEGAGNVSGTVSFSVPALVPITVAITSNDATELIVPSSIAFATGQTSSTFNVTPIDDGIVDGTQTVILTAHVNGWTDGTATVSVLDNGHDATMDWSTFGNGPAHTGYQPITLGTTVYQPGWTKTFPTSTGGINQVAVNNGTIFVTPYEYYSDTYLSALDAATGTERWRRSFVSSFSINPPTVDAGNVYVQKGNSTNPGNDSQLWCINAASGTSIWIAPFGAQGERYFAPTVVNDGVWVDGGTYGGLYGFNTGNGSQRFFNSSLEQYDQWTPTYYNGTIYSWVAGVFRAHDPTTGAILWSSTLSTGNPYSMNTVPAADAGRAFVIGNPNLYAIDLTTHATAWTVSGTFKGTPAAAGGRAYVLTGSDVKAYNSQTGALIGTYATGNTSIAGQPIVTNDSLIVTATSSTYIFNLQTFALRQTLSSGGVASLAGGILYVAGGDGILRTFRPPALNTITLSLSASSAREGSPALTGTVSLATTMATNTVIGFATGSSGRITLPASVAIPAGQTSVTFPLVVVDDSLLNGSQTVIVATRGPSISFVDGSAAITIHDNETATMSLSVPASAAEGTTSVTGTLTLSAAPAVNIAVSLASSDTTAVTVPADVTVLAGQTSATFPISVVDDTRIDGTQTATITASVNGWTPANASLQITDNENRNLTFSLGSSVAEGGTTSGTVFISGTLPGNLVVSLSSATPSQLTVPASVTILAGSTNASFTITGVDDTATDGTQIVAITATAATFTAVTQNVSVTDNDVHHFTFATAIATPQVANRTFTTSIEARDVNDVRINTYGGSLNLTALGAGGALTVAPATATLSSGFWSGTLVIATPATGVAITARAGTLSGVSNSFDVGIGALDHLSWNPVASPQTTGVAFNATLLAKDAYENTVTTVNGATSVSAGPPPVLTGTGTSQPATLFEASTQERIQSIYQRAEVGAAGRINSVAMQVFVFSGGTFSATVRMKHTPLASYGVSPAWENTGWTVVFQGNLTFPAVSGSAWVTVPLSTPFQFDGSSNLMLDISHNGGSVHVHSIATIATTTRTLYFSGSGYADPLTWSGTSNPAPFTSTGLLNLRLGFEGTLPVAPASVTLANGVWTGALAVQQAATGIVLKARTTTGVTGDSNAFNVTGPPIPTLAISPADGLTSAGSRGGPFAPTGKDFTLSNPGVGTVAWTASKTAPWLNLSATGGTLAAGASTIVTASLNAAANALASGNFADTITFTNTTNGGGNATRPVALAIAAIGELTVTPATGLDASGPVGGPFTPANQVYTLRNSGDAALNWTAAKTAPWLTLSGTSGTLAPNSSTPVIATIAGASLEAGSYSDSVTFTNSTTGRGNTARAVTLSVILPAPVLAAEPLFTGGTGNTVTWSAVSAASDYEAQAATDAAFTSPVSSGWVAGTSHTFTGLNGGTRYSYRVHARRQATEQTGAWTQTTQAEFDTDTKVSVVSNTPGNVTLASGNGFPIPGRPANASFESGTLGSGGTVTNWTIDNTLEMIAWLNSGGPSPMPTNGTQWLNLFTHYQTAHAPGDYVRVTQSVDFTGVSSLMFDTALTSSGAWSGTIVAEVRIDNTIVWGRSALGNYLNQSVNVGAYTGVHTLELRNTVTAPGTYDSQWTMWDNLRLIPPSGYATSGTLTSALIAPSPRQRWGALAFTKDTSAAGTALTVDVLDAGGALLAANVAAGTDLNTIAAVASQPSIRLRANLSTTNVANTPRLDDWTVSYVTALAQTSISAWSNVAASTQDATAPALAIVSPNTVSTTPQSLAGTASDASGISSITVNGVAVVSGDGFAHWSLPVALVPGANTFTIVARDNALPANATTVTHTITLTTAVGDADGDGLPDAWEALYGLSTTDGNGANGALGDPDGDGRITLLELALGTSPVVPDASGLSPAAIVTDSGDGKSYLTWNYRRLITPGALSYIVETCTDLSQWHSGPGWNEEVGAPVANPDGITETVTVRALPPIGPGTSAGNIRLRIAVP